MLRERVVVHSDPSAVERGCEVLRKGGLVVAPTDTIYGVLADATSAQAVERLYRIRRPSRKPFIVLIPDLAWVGKLGLLAGCRELRLLNVPALTLRLPKTATSHHHLGAGSLAVRYPRRGFVLRLLKRFNRPVVAPSANREGCPPARSVEEAIAYFGEEVDLYVDGGRCAGKASAVVDSRGKVYRAGSYSPESIGRIFLLICRIPCPEPDRPPPPLCPDRP